MSSGSGTASAQDAEVSTRPPTVSELEYLRARVHDLTEGAKSADRVAEGAKATAKQLRSELLVAVRDLKAAEGRAE